MPSCRFWKDQPDGFHGYCTHPEAQPGTPCILNTEDSCLLYEERATKSSIKVTHDTLLRLQRAMPEISKAAGEQGVFIRSYDAALNFLLDDFIESSHN